MRILILSATTGGGHMKAAEALRDFLSTKPDTVVEVVDTLEYISTLLNKTITETYLHMAKRVPKMFGYIYNKSNKENKFSDMIVFLNKIFSKKLLSLIKRFSPDVIITTHMFPTLMVSNLKGKNCTKIPLICVMTDYAPHRTWISENVNAYVVANSDMTAEMVQMGAPAEKIHAFGIPINPLFFEKKNRTKILSEIGLNPSTPTVLVMAGSFGVTNILKIYNQLAAISIDFQVVVITGKNKRMYQTFKNRISKKNSLFYHEFKHIRSKILLKSNIKFSSEKLDKLIKKIKIKESLPTKATRLIYFTDEVYNYMHAADLIITKPGGLTVSEAIASSLPMAVFDAIPGQEEENAEFLVKNNMAVKIGKGLDCKNIIEDLLRDKNSLFSMKKSCESFDKSKSNENIYNLIVELTSNDMCQVLTDTNLNQEICVI